MRGWGTGTVSGGINLFMWIAYIISIALYAQGFSAYFMTFFTTIPTPVLTKSVACAIVISLLLCLILFCILEVYTYQHAPVAVYTMILLLVGSFIVEKVMRKIR